MSIEALKEQARQHEQNEKWGEALQVYIDAINRQTDEDQADLGLYNRAGDLSTRIGDAVGAIQYYEQAVDLYLEAELPNNAIAILKKILRNLPARSEVFLRMGQIRANQGFLTDARNNFLTYAERRQQEGDMDEAFRALEEFADLAPSDVEVRLALADQLHAHERSPEALQQLSHAYHQYNVRGEVEAAQGIEQRILEIDSAFVIPEESDLSQASAFETNVLAADGEFDGDFTPDASVEAAFDEIAFDGSDEIALETNDEVVFDDVDEIALDDSDAVAFSDSDELSDTDEITFGDSEETAFSEAEEVLFEGADDVTSDEFASVEPDASAELAADHDEESPFGEVNEAVAFAETSHADEDDDDVFGFADEDEALDFGTAVFSEEGEAATVASSLPEAEADAPLDEQDDWDIGTDIEDAFISFETPETTGFETPETTEASLDEAKSDDALVGGHDLEEHDLDEDEDLAAWSIDPAVAESIDAAAEASAETAADFDGEESEHDDSVAATSESDSLESADLEDAEAWEAVAEVEQDDAPLLATEDDHESTELDPLPLTSFDAEDESFDSEVHVEAETQAQVETDTAVALEGAFEDEAETAEQSWDTSEPDLASEDDLWSEAEPEAEAESESQEAAQLEADEDDEWIGLDASATDLESETEETTLDAASDEDVEAPAIAATPSLSDFEAYSLSDLREYVGHNPGTGSAWERIGRVTLEEGNTAEAQRAFEEAHIAYALTHDYMSAMRCVRELLLGEPDQMMYHQRLVEYAGHSSDRTLLVSAYLELADCLTRTGAPAKAQAVHAKVLEIDPTNRRAAAAMGESEEDTESTDGASDANYVDLGSMVIDRGEKTTRWTVESEEPVDGADFDFQNMLAQFKAKVAENVDVGDVKAHYDLGTAYKEMGLVEEAITEFQAALRADGQNLATYEMLGQCFMDKGQPEVAVRSLQRAIEMPFDVEDELLGIYYYLGRAHEELDNADEAIEYYEKIFALDINFEDVTERLRALR